MSELERLEREVAEARARLRGDLAKLRPSDTLTDAKDRLGTEVGQVKRRLTAEAERLKARAVETTKDAARQRAEGMLEAVKARVAANPGAAIVLGAGLAYRLYKHPPVATVLVGAGLMGLLRTDPKHPVIGSEAAARAAEFAGSAYRRVEEWREGDPAAQAAEFAGHVRDQAGELVETAKQRVTEWRHDTRDAARHAVEQARHSASRAASRASAMSRQGRRRLADAMPESENRDAYLAGVAALALAAAIGIAARRQMGPSARRNGHRRSLPSRDID
jgi:hypothetical protein